MQNTGPVSASYGRGVGVESSSGIVVPSRSGGVAYYRPYPSSLDLPPAAALLSSPHPAGSPHAPHHNTQPQPQPQLQLQPQPVQKGFAYHAGAALAQQQQQHGYYHVPPLVQSTPPAPPRADNEEEEADEAALSEAAYGPLFPPAAAEGGGGGEEPLAFPHMDIAARRFGAKYIMDRIFTLSTLRRRKQQQQQQQLSPSASRNAVEVDGEEDEDEDDGMNRSLTQLAKALSGYTYATRRAQRLKQDHHDHQPSSWSGGPLGSPSTSASSMDPAMASMFPLRHKGRGMPLPAATEPINAITGRRLVYFDADHPPASVLAEPHRRFIGVSFRVRRRKKEQRDAKPNNNNNNNTGSAVREEEFIHATCTPFYYGTVLGYSDDNEEVVWQERTMRFATRFRIKDVRFLLPVEGLRCRHCGERQLDSELYDHLATHVVLSALTVHSTSTELLSTTTTATTTDSIARGDPPLTVSELWTAAAAAYSSTNAADEDGLDAGAGSGRVHTLHTILEKRFHKPSEGVGEVASTRVAVAVAAALPARVLEEIGSMVIVGDPVLGHACGDTTLLRRMTPAGLLGEGAQGVVELYRIHRSAREAQQAREQETREPTCAAAVRWAGEKAGDGTVKIDTAIPLATAGKRGSAEDTAPERHTDPDDPATAAGDTSIDMEELKEGPRMVPQELQEVQEEGGEHGAQQTIDAPPGGALPSPLCKEDEGHRTTPKDEGHAARPDERCSDDPKGEERMVMATQAHREEEEEEEEAEAVGGSTLPETHCPIIQPPSSPLLHETTAATNTTAVDPAACAGDGAALADPCVVVKTFCFQGAPARAVKHYHKSVRLMSMLADPSCPASLISYYTVQLLPDGTTVRVLMPYFSAGDLGAFIRNSTEPLDESLLLLMAMQLTDALHFLHQRNPPLVHGDINPGNIMYADGGRRVVLVDLDASCEFKAKGGAGDGQEEEEESGGASTTKTRKRGAADATAPLRGSQHHGLGTSAFMAPETISCERIMPASDMWSLGMLLYVLAVRPAFPTLRDPRTGEEVLLNTTSCWATEGDRLSISVFRNTRSNRNTSVRPHLMEEPPSSQGTTAASRPVASLFTRCVREAVMSRGYSPAFARVVVHLLQFNPFRRPSAAGLKASLALELQRCGTPSPLPYLDEEDEEDDGWGRSPNW